MAFIPRVGASFLDHRGEVSKEWRDYLQQLPADQALDAIRAELQALANRISDLDQNAPQAHNLLGQGSVRVYGDLTQSNATAQLDGDQDAPAANHYYGTDETGARGFFERLLATLADVDLSTPPASGDVLRHDGTAWVAGALALDDLADVDAPSPTAGQVLAFNGTEWAPATNLATATFNYISADGEPYATEDGDLYIGV